MSTQHLQLSVQAAAGIEEALQGRDLFCVLRLGDTEHKSEPAKADSNNTVSWNQQFSFKATSCDEIVSLKIYDTSSTADMKEPVGLCKIPLLQSHAIEVDEDETQVPILTKDDEAKGHVSVQLRFGTGRGLVSSNSISEPCSPGQPQSQWLLPAWGGSDCWSRYERGTVLGRGTYATTYEARSKATGQICAVKSVRKDLLKTATEVEALRREVRIMHHIAGHPNIATLQEVHEDEQCVNLVMEVCDGRPLFEAMAARGRYTEKDAAATIRTIVGVVAHCHNMGVIHRDINPENFLLAHRDVQHHTGELVLKTIDFGKCYFFTEGQYFSQLVSAPHFMAPEMLRGNYTKDADVWACGVILYMLLCGRPPFQGVDRKEILEAINIGALDLKEAPWPSVSEPAKDCVRKMLTRDPKVRATTTQILRHPWLKASGCAPDAPLRYEVLTRLTRFSVMNGLKKEALRVIAMHLPMDEVHGMREIFVDMDSDKSGTITAEEFAEALRKKGRSIPRAELEDILMEADMNGDGLVDYEEFLAATLYLGKLEREENLWAAFRHFDLDGDGAITRQELSRALSQLDIRGEDIDAIVEAVDADGSGTIDYPEFVAMMRSRDS